MPNVAMWGKALTAMPRIGKGDWDESRSGLALADRDTIRGDRHDLHFGGLCRRARLQGGCFRWPLLFALVTTCGLCLAHATNNLINDLTDYWKGVDKDNYFRTQYGPQTVQDGFLSVRQLMTYAGLTGIVALGIGFYLVFASNRGDVTLLLLASGAFFVLFYTFPLKYIGMGEPAVLVVWGPLMVGGSYFVITGHVEQRGCAREPRVRARADGRPFREAYGQARIRPREGDSHAARDPRREPISRKVTVGLLLAQYPVIAYLVYIGFFHPVMLVSFASMFSLKRVFQVFGRPRPDGPPPDLPAGVWPLWFVGVAFWFTRRYSGFFLLGLVLDLLFTKL